MRCKTTRHDATQCNAMQCKSAQRGDLDTSEVRVGLARYGEGIGESQRPVIDWTRVECVFGAGCSRLLLFSFSDTIPSKGQTGCLEFTPIFARVVSFSGHFVVTLGLEQFRSAQVRSDQIRSGQVARKSIPFERSGPAAHLTYMPQGCILLSHLP